MHAIVVRMRLPFSKIFSNFVHFCLTFQMFCHFLPFFWKITRMPLLSRIDHDLLFVKRKRLILKTTQPGEQYVGNKVKGRISKRMLQENKACQIFLKTNISYSIQGIRIFVFRKLWRALFSCNTRPFALLPTNIFQV